MTADQALTEAIRRTGLNERGLLRVFDQRYFVKGTRLIASGDITREQALEVYWQLTGLHTRALTELGVF